MGFKNSIQSHMITQIECEIKHWTGNLLYISSNIAYCSCSHPQKQNMSFHCSLDDMIFF